MVSVGTPARSLSSVRSRISPGGVSSINCTNGSMASEYWTRCGMGMVSFSVSAALFGLACFTLLMDAAPLLPARLLPPHRGGGGSGVGRRRFSGAVSVRAEISCHCLSYDQHMRSGSEVNRLQQGSGRAVASHRICAWLSDGASTIKGAREDRSIPRPYGREGDRALPRVPAASRTSWRDRRRCGGPK